MKESERSTSEFLSRSGTSLVAPAGMSDLLPPDAAERRELARSILGGFELAGYDLVTPPVFEHAEVMRRGNELFDNRDLLRFMEPDSGEVAVLRPDITPQVARIIATRLTGHPPPLRLCYEGRVFRRHRGRARSHRQITQVGVECVGIPARDADTEVLALLIGALDSVGLQSFRVELSDATLVRSLLESVPEEARAAVTEALSRKDATALHSLCRQHELRRDSERELAALLHCYGERDVLADAKKRFKTQAGRLAIGNLGNTLQRLDELGLSERVVFDLSETRGWEYYTGLHFTVLADGPGEALAQGGRYDGLLARFGRDAPATGFALALGHLQWTLHRQGRALRGKRPLRIAVCHRPANAARELLKTLRASGVIAASLPYSDAARCLSFARAWGYDAILTASGGRVRMLRASDGSRTTLDTVTAKNIRRALAP